MRNIDDFMRLDILLKAKESVQYNTNRDCHWAFKCLCCNIESVAEKVMSDYNLNSVKELIPEFGSFIGVKRFKGNSRTVAWWSFDEEGMNNRIAYLSYLISIYTRKCNKIILKSLTDAKLFLLHCDTLGFRPGLCYCISKGFEKNSIHRPKGEILNLIPLFNNGIASDMFKAKRLSSDLSNRNEYWWNNSSESVKYRASYLDWIISRYIKEINSGTSGEVTTKI